MSPRKNWDAAGLKEALSRGGATEHGGVGGGVMERDSPISPTIGVKHPVAARNSRKPVSNLAHAPLEYKGQVYKSKGEIRFAQHLEVLAFAGEIDGWRYEPVNFRLSNGKNFYKVDFASWQQNKVYFHEVKGYSVSNDRSLVKIKTAASLNPWATFTQWKWIGGQWMQRVIFGRERMVVASPPQKGITT